MRKKQKDLINWGVKYDLFSGKPIYFRAFFSSQTSTLNPQILSPHQSPWNPAATRSYPSRTAPRRAMVPPLTCPQNPAFPFPLPQPPLCKMRATVFLIPVSREIIPDFGGFRNAISKTALFAHESRITDILLTNITTFDNNKKNSLELNTVMQIEWTSVTLRSWFLHMRNAPFTDTSASLP